MKIYNRSVVNIKRARGVFGASSNIFKCGEEVILSLFEDLDASKIQNILIYGRRADMPNLSLHAHVDYEFYEENTIPQKKYDLIISFFDLGTIDKIQEFLFKAKISLTENGAFIGCFIGGNSLIKTREALWAFEENMLQKFYSRIHPMIKLTDFTSLLQQAGFINVISFKDEYEFKFKNLLDCLKSIQKTGESGGLFAQEYFPKSIYKLLLSEPESEYKETFEIIGFCASKTTNLFANRALVC